MQNENQGEETMTCMQAVTKIEEKREHRLNDSNEEQGEDIGRKKAKT